jgi:hypothetical protein
MLRMAMHIHIHALEEIGTADGYVDISDYTVWTGIAKDEERIYKEK